MEPKLKPSTDPKFYFSNIDYSDYRELICFERPACFVLHFYFGFTSSRLWLYDRFDFSFLNGELQNNSNALAEFFKSEAVVKEHIVTESLKTFAQQNLKRNQAIVVPIETKVGSSTLVTSFLLEKIDGDTINCSCFRGDDFFIAKPFSLEEIESRLHRTDGKTTVHLITVPTWIETSEVSANTIWKSSGLLTAFEQKINDSSSTRSSSGAAHLQTFLCEKLKGPEVYRQKVQEGFLNVLLAEIFWPMLFAYSPFVVFLRYALRENLELPAYFDLNKIEVRLQTIATQAEVITNLAYMFGRNPTDKSYNRFVSACEAMTEHYGTLEAELVESVTV